MSASDTPTLAADLPGSQGDELTLASGAASARPVDELATGASLGRYLVLERLGSGGMGAVFAAYDPQLARKVAIKVLHADNERHDAQPRLEREAQALARLSHRNVVPVHDVGTHEGRVFIAMEYVEGQTLKQWMRNRAHGWEEVRRVFAQAGEGLAAAHAAGLIHRDFKPENVMLGRDGRVLVMDFGLAKETGADTYEREPIDVENLPSGRLDESVTVAGSLLGTPGYMAAEQYLGGQLDARTDQFAFCVSMWEALFGERPFAGSNVHELVGSVLAGRRRDPATGRSVPRELVAILSRGLSVDPVERWPSMQALLNELARDPRRLWKGAAAVLAVGVAAGGVVLSQRVEEHRAAQVCAERGDEIARYWNEDAAGALEDAFTIHAPGFGADAYQSARSAMDAYAADWSETATQVCAEPPATVEATNRCLDDAREELAALAALFGAAKEEMMMRVNAAIARLPDPQRCLDGRHLALQPALPDDAEQRERVAQLRRELIGATALVRTGAVEDAVELARKAAETAPGIGLPWLVADAQITLGDALERAGEFEEAGVHLREGYFLASQSGNDTAALRASAVLVFLLSDRLAKVEEASWWAPHAEALEIKVGQDHPLIPDLHSSLGVLWETKGDYATAVEHFERAATLREALLGPDHPNVASDLSSLAGMLDANGDPLRARQAYERALKIRRQALGPGHPFVAYSLDGLGSLLVGQGKHEEGLALMQEGLEIFLGTYGPDHPEVGVTYNNLATTAQEIGDNDKALSWHRKAQAIFRHSFGPEHPYTAASLMNIGIVLDDQGKHEEAIAMYEQVIELKVKALGEDHPTLGDAYINLAVAQKLAGDADAAWESATRGLGIYEKGLEPEHPKVASALVNVGQIALQRKQRARAQQALERALLIADQQDLDPSLEGDIRMTLGQILEDDLRARSRAHALVEAALEQFTEVGPRSETRAEEARAWLADHPS